VLVHKAVILKIYKSLFKNFKRQDSFLEAITAYIVAIPAGNWMFTSSAGTASYAIIT